MTITKLKSFVACVVTAAALFAAARAEAFHHHRGWGSSGGSWGSSGGSWGSSGGSWGSSGGSWGSSGGGWGSSGGGWGSSGGSWGSCGGSSGGYSYGSSGGSSGGYSWGSSGGSSGGHVIYEGTAPQEIQQDQKPVVPAEATPPAAGDSSAQYRDNSGTLIVTVPADAQVTVNGRLTTTTGTERRFVSRGLKPGARYSYEVQVEATRDGQPVSETKSIDLTAGTISNLAFNFSGDKDPVAKAAEPLRTTLVVNVPADAKLMLAGHDSNSSGAVREFTTTKLAPGSEWTNYVVHAEIVRNGQVISKEESVSLKAGDSRKLTLNFDEDATGKVAGTDAR